jgi:hypothetical protein
MHSLFLQPTSLTIDRAQRANRDIGIGVRNRHATFSGRMDKLVVVSPNVCQLPAVSFK